MFEERKKLDNIQQQARGIKNPVARRDLLKMIATVDLKLTEMSKESVRCRQRGNITGNYQKMTRELSEMMENLEGFLMVALLSN
jgi:hypothetical protein